MGQWRLSSRERCGAKKALALRPAPGLAPPQLAVEVAAFFEFFLALMSFDATKDKEHFKPMS